MTPFPMSPKEMRQCREYAILDAMRKIGKPCGRSQITPMLPPVPVHVTPGMCVLRKLPHGNVYQSLQRMSWKGWVACEVSKEYGWAYLFRVLDRAPAGGYDPDAVSVTRCGHPATSMPTACDATPSGLETAHRRAVGVFDGGEE